jgi:hypothetical protein
VAGKTETTVKAYKAFKPDWTCQGFQYEVGKEYVHTGTVKPCSSGFHACENPLDVLNYYDLIESKFAEVELSGVIVKEKDKSCAEKIKIIKEISIFDYIHTAADDIINAAKKQKDGQPAPEVASGDSSTAASSGDYSTAASSGNSSKAASSGNSSKAASSGDYSKAASSGDSSTAASSGYSSTAASSGYYSTAASSGDYSKAASSGYYSTAASSGDYSKAASSGDSSKAASSGDYSKAASSGDSSKAEVTGQHCAAAAVGANCKVKGSEGSPVALCHYVDSKPVKFVCGVIGMKGLKADTWYKLNDKGKFTEA